MALRSADSPSGSQPIISSDSERHKESKSKGWIGPISLLMVLATIEAAVAFVMGYTCTKAYMSSAPNIGITGFAKKSIFMAFVLCNSIPMLASVVAVKLLIRAMFSSELIDKVGLFVYAMELVTITYFPMLVAFTVGVCLVVILLPWYSYFT